MNFNNRSVLIIGHTLPEPKTTAAGVRMMQLISFFQSHNAVVHFATAAGTANNAHAEDLSQIGILVHQLILNDDGVDAVLDACRPDIVLFDRFMTEEQFGWRIRAHSPAAITILDTEDLHFLRKARQTAFENNRSLDIYTDLSKRELSSIWRCDVSLIISKFEYHWLQETFGVPDTLLFYWPIVFEAPTSPRQSFAQSSDFVCVGNLNHAPNLDAVQWLINDLWPQIENQLPGVLLHICGAYGREGQVRHWSKTRGVVVHGWVADIDQVLSTSRVNLAPLRFGAGLKGKILHALEMGLPTLTTPIGAEGITNGQDQVPCIAETDHDMIQRAVALYQDHHLWQSQQVMGQELIKVSFNKAHFYEMFTAHMSLVAHDITAHRQRHFLGQVFQHQTLYASKYMGRWLTLKEQLSTQSVQDKYVGIDKKQAIDKK
ncbi:glycosyltransferase family 4 protein [Flavobacteriaceae bacterium]|nr:glycosyltransferase family 4 protein [Flavobacteriaceae bacterium]